MVQFLHPTNTEMEQMDTDINKEIASAMPAVMARIKREALDSIERQAIDVATRVAVEAAREWATTNLVPEIKAQLEAGKAGMVKAAQEAAEELGDAVKDALVAAAVKNLASSWNLKKVVEGMFA